MASARPPGDDGTRDEHRRHPRIDRQHGHQRERDESRSERGHPARGEHGRPFGQAEKAQRAATPVTRQRDDREMQARSTFRQRSPPSRRAGALPASRRARDPARSRAGAFGRAAARRSRSARSAAARAWRGRGCGACAFSRAALLTTARALHFAIEARRPQYRQRRGSAAIRRTDDAFGHATVTPRAPRRRLRDFASTPRPETHRDFVARAAHDLE